MKYEFIDTPVNDSTEVDSIQKMFHHSFVLESDFIQVANMALYDIDYNNIDEIFD